MTDVDYIDNMSKIDFLSIKLSNKWYQLLIDHDMPPDYVRYITDLHKLDTDICAAN